MRQSVIQSTQTILKLPCVKVATGQPLQDIDFTYCALKARHFGRNSRRKLMHCTHFIMQYVSFHQPKINLSLTVVLLLTSHNG